MQLSSAPSKIVEAFGINAAPSGGYGGKRTIPVPSQTGITPGAASYNDGFPPLTMTPLPGGVVMSGLDMNGILNEATAVDWWMSAGGTFKFDSVFAAAVGGYPKGARLLNAAANGFWTSIIDNNSNNPDTGGAGWIPDRAHASAYQSSGSVLGSGNAQVPIDTAEYDTFGMFQSGSNNFLALWAGVYRFSGAALLTAPPAGELAIQVFKNGSLAKEGLRMPQVSDQNLTFTFDALILCAVNDTLDIRIVNTTGSIDCGPVSGSGVHTVYGQVEYLGPQ